ncbi:MAG: hypothetical protein AAB492_02170 [Patescibacteria group bacterium]
MSEFVTIDNHEVSVKNPSRERFGRPRKLRAFPSSVSFQFSMDDFGDEFIYSINGARLQYQTMELSRNITFRRFNDGSCAFSYLTDRDDEKTRHFVSQPWELLSATRELNLQISYV